MMKTAPSRQSQLLPAGVLAAALLLLGPGCQTTEPEPEQSLVPKWERFEAVFQSSKTYPNPFQALDVTVRFTAPDGETFLVPAFWNGGTEWRVRFAPTLAGPWAYETIASDTGNLGLHGVRGEFLCTAPVRNTPFHLHGPVQVARNQRYFTHRDLKPFFWLADNTGNNPRQSTEVLWMAYLQTRSQEGFTAVQWNAIQATGAPAGDLNGRSPFRGGDTITPNPDYFAHLDAQAQAVANVGLLNVPMLLWAAGDQADAASNSPSSLPEEQAIKLARYMVARWQHLPVVWLLAGNVGNSVEQEERWQRIGEGVFGDIHHGPALLQGAKNTWLLPAFSSAPWLDALQYQMPGVPSAESAAWLVADDPATDWKESPYRPFVGVATTRRELYWCLLNAPTAGVGVDAANLQSPQEISHLKSFFTGVDFWKLRPAPEVLARQPGATAPQRHVSVSRSDDGTFTVGYVPDDRSVEIRLSELPPRPQISWFNPRTGETGVSVGVVSGGALQLPTPAEGDWLLLIRAGN